MNDDDFNFPDEKPSETSYSITVDDHLHKKLDKHLRILKILDHSKLSKQKWIENAIKAKLQNKIDLQKELPSKNKHLMFRVNKKLNEEIAEQVEILKRFRDSYSKKQWFVEAIQEQLEKEESKTKQFLEEFQKN